MVNKTKSALLVNYKAKSDYKAKHCPARALVKQVKTLVISIVERIHWRFIDHLITTTSATIACKPPVCLPNRPFWLESRSCAYSVCADQEYSLVK
ncbi:hypothetical protein TYRP_002332 [Tyrophagus putrescentiae]|nr:hypothetical protein TYRP_002332 [Tyrophagus putrescentiae]